MSAPINQTSEPPAPDAAAETPTPLASRGDGATSRGASRRLPARQRPVHLVSVAVGVAGVLIVMSLVWLTEVANAHTQQHLLRTQAGAAGLVLGQVIPSIRTPLTTAAAIADASAGDLADVTTYVASDVGPGKGHLFTSLSLWRLGPGGPDELLSLGQPADLPEDRPALQRFFERIPGPEELAVTRPRSGSRLGFAVESVGDAPRYVVYAESDLPPDRRAIIPPSSAFHDLNFALYLGHPRTADLLESTVPHVPLRGPTVRITVPFGTTHLDFVAEARHPLGGGVLPLLPWIIGALGAVIVAAGVVTAEWLQRRRRTAERLADENMRLYAEQRSISQTLQTALLPKALPVIAGIELSARYVPGDPAADVGGDWYDVIRYDDHTLLFAIGDVSGRGVPAANTMASLHHAIRAYAAQGDDAQTILEKLTALLDVVRDGHFATVLLGHVDVPARQITAVSAGHPPPLVVCDGGAYFVSAVPGAPIGVSEYVSYVPITIRVPPRTSVLAYTDGLVERRGEILDTGLERLRSIAIDNGGSRPLIEAVVAGMLEETPTDDVALLELRWTS